MKRTQLLLALGAILIVACVVLFYQGTEPEARPEPDHPPAQRTVVAPMNASAEVSVEVRPPPPAPPPPAVLPARQPRRSLNPTRAEVQAIMARMRRGPEQEPEWEKLNYALIALDFRDYPEEFAEMIGGPGYFFYVWDGLKRKLHANDDPDFLQAVLDFFHREQARLKPPTRYFDFIQFFAHMTNSPALVPPLIKGLESPDYRAVSATAFALSLLPSPESAKALVEHAKRQGPPPANLPEDSHETYVHQEIARLRSLALIPYFEEQLAAAKDEHLRQHLKFAILASRANLPAFPTEEAWKGTWKKVEEWK